MQLEHVSDSLDPELWFPCVHHPGSRDVLYPATANTFRGRMPAWCEHRQVSFRVSLSGLPDDTPLATRKWVRGFLAGAIPPLDDETALDRQRLKVDAFLTTGSWPDE